MSRSYYSESIDNFIKENISSILGKLSINHQNRTLVDLQKNAWIEQIKILQTNLVNLSGHIFFEFIIPRMGKRVDNVIIINDTIYIIEFKIGDTSYDKYAINQVIDYTLDLINFHEGSHNKKLLPILVSSNAPDVSSDISLVKKHVDVIKCNQNNLRKKIVDTSNINIDYLDPIKWENSIYKPTPTIIEAAQALYKGHNVKEISRSDAGAINLSYTTTSLNQIIEYSKINNKKSICFVTGVPGAGKTLAGLNIANERMKAHEDEHAVFLSGNGPLVDVLREALTRDIVNNDKEFGLKTKKDDAKRKSNAFIQNIHHFRDEYLRHKIEPTEKVVVFDEAQRAWTSHQVSKFMKAKKGISNFDMSEPEFLIDVMNRHEKWCSIICLIGGGQEINTGEAGLEAWVTALKEKYSEWDVYYSNLITDNTNYLKNNELKTWLLEMANQEDNLNLSVSVRSFRSEKLSNFIHELLDLNTLSSQKIYSEIINDFPIYITRDLNKSKNWLKNISKGSERIGIVSSSGARRLRPHGIDVKNKITPANWFLNGMDDIRSSYFLEEIATEFDIQGLEIDWTCVAWGGNFHIKNNKWIHKNFNGNKWQNINNEIDKDFLKNAYRVLLTRARQGMVLFIPYGSDTDLTRPKSYYDGTYEYLKEVGIKEL